MRFALAILGLIALAGPVRAGVYDLGEQHPFVPWAKTRGYVLRMRGAAEALPGVPDPDSFRAGVLRDTADLERIRAGGLFSTHERIDLSGCYLRLGRAKDALDLLTAGKHDHFMLQANLASAYFLSGEMEMAIRTQSRVLAAWPSVWFGWTEQERVFYRDCERALLRLFESRNEEAREKKSEVGVDPLFPGLRYVGPEGVYAAGGLSVPMRDRLPPNGGEILFQLCKWYPTDRRLYWQLGELLNVSGHIDQAAGIFDELVDGGRSGIFRDLGAHRRVLRDALPAYRALEDPHDRGMLLSQMLLIPRPMLGAPGVGGAAYVGGSGAALIAVPHLSKEVVPTPPPPVVPPAASIFEWRHLLATFAMGFLVAALMGWQLQLWMGRKTAG